MVTTLAVLHSSRICAPTAAAEPPTADHDLLPLRLAQSPEDLDPRDRACNHAPARTEVPTPHWRPDYAVLLPRLAVERGSATHNGVTVRWSPVLGFSVDYPDGRTDEGIHSRRQLFEALRGWVTR